MMHKLLLATASVLACSAALAANADSSYPGFFGQSEPSGYATRTIVIDANTTEVNVERGDVVKFVVGDKSFAWSFSTPTTISEIDLNSIAPAGTLDHVVKAYIKRMPIYDGG